eukprot:GHVU01144531.1.p2 GENE.GHVU01144531.1~~GHVU01144531.1.p2  ORF type:complete len:107 (-),score=0.56 GHVU01144531.1:291-611(-)
MSRPHISIAVPQPYGDRSTGSVAKRDETAHTYPPGYGRPVTGMECRSSIGSAGRFDVQPRYTCVFPPHACIALFRREAIVFIGTEPPDLGVEAWAFCLRSRICLSL